MCRFVPLNGSDLMIKCNLTDWKHIVRWVGKAICFTLSLPFNRLYLSGIRWRMYLSREISRQFCEGGTRGFPSKRVCTILAHRCTTLYIAWNIESMWKVGMFHKMCLNSNNIKARWKRETFNINSWICWMELSCSFTDKHPFARLKVFA